jgi:hypothetical protein
VPPEVVPDSEQQQAAPAAGRLRAARDLLDFLIGEPATRASQRSAR